MMRTNLTNCILQVDLALRIARVLQVHTCSSYCAKGTHNGELCSVFFPRLPSLYPHMALRPKRATDKAKQWFATVADAWIAMKDLLRSERTAGPRYDGVRYDVSDEVRSLLDFCSRLGDGGTAVPLDSGGYYFAGVELHDGAWLRYHLDKCRAFSQNEEEIATLGCYHMLTSVRLHSKVMPRRTLAEVWVANYNPHVTISTVANHEIEVVCHTPALAEAYITKGSSSREGLYTAADELRGAGGRVNWTAAERLRREADWSRRELPLAEAFYGLDSRLSPLRFTGLREPVVIVTHRRFQDGHPVVTELKLRYAYKHVLRRNGVASNNRDLQVFSPRTKVRASEPGSVRHVDWPTWRVDLKRCAAFPCHNCPLLGLWPR